MLLMLNTQVSGLHFVRLYHVAQSLIGLFLGILQLNYLLQELHSLVVEEASRFLSGFQGQRCAHLEKDQKCIIKIIIIIPFV